MSTAARVGMFTPASVVKFTGGAHIRAFTPRRTLADMSPQVRLKPEFRGKDGAINMDKLADAVNLDAHEIPGIADGHINPTEFNRIESYLGTPYPPDRLRNEERRSSRENGFTTKAMLARIGEPEDTLETMNIASVLVNNIGPRNKISMKDEDDKKAWASLTAAYLSHMGYEYPREAGAAIGRIILGGGKAWISDMHYAGNRNVFLNSVIDKIYSDDSFKKAQAMSAAVMHMYPGDEKGQIRAMAEMERMEGSRPFIFHVMENWHNWQYLADVPEVSPFIQSAIKFAGATAGDTRLSLMIKAALSQVARDIHSRERKADILSPSMQKSMNRSSFAQALAQIADGLDMNMPAKIQVLIDAARMVRSDDTISEMNLKDFAAEEAIRYLLSPNSI
jgi:hypothetical protein